MTDDDFNDAFHDRASDERIRALVAAHYNPPAGTVPRDAMWATVRAARVAERHAVVLPLRGASRQARWAWGAALAAGLMLGVALDRAATDRPGPRAAGSVATTAPRTPSAAASVDSPAATRVAGVTGGSGDAGATRGARVPAPSVTEAPGTEARRVASSAPAVRAPAAAGTPRPLTGATPSLPPMPSAQGLYQVVAVQTLVQAEALLTAYRVEPRATDAEAMRQTARWSREVLSSTRLLLDSPAGRDPQLRKLLSDLELVLAQIVQLSGTPLQAGERELIERAMHDRDLIPRLRSVVPASATTT